MERKEKEGKEKKNGKKTGRRKMKKGDRTEGRKRVKKIKWKVRRIKPSPKILHEPCSTHMDHWTGLYLANIKAKMYSFFFFLRLTRNKNIFFILGSGRPRTLNRSAHDTKLFAPQNYATNNYVNILAELGKHHKFV